MADAFYEELAGHYHLIFADWDAAMAEQGAVLAGLLPPPDAAGPVLDCACGIGTQALALAARGYRVEASDLSPAALARAQREAAARALDVAFRLDDMRALAEAPRGRYGAVVCLDNALPHLDSDAEIAQALAAMRDRLAPGGALLISLRDYGPLMAARPSFVGPLTHGEAPGRRLLHQLWRWRDDRRYAFELIMTFEHADGACDQRRFAGAYRAVTPDEVADQVRAAGFGAVEVLMPEASGFYQPLVRARRPA